MLGTFGGPSADSLLVQDYSVSVVRCDSIYAVFERLRLGRAAYSRVQLADCSCWHGVYS